MDAVLPDADTQSQVLAELKQIVGVDRVAGDEARRKLFSQDIYKVSDDVVVAVVSPEDTDQLARVVSVAARHDLHVAPRGAGMSYTAGYVPTSPRTLSIDTSRMDKVLKVNAEDMTVTVQAGCTWKTLHDTLTPLGLRTPFWGPLSGLTSTVGGGLSQLNAFFGASLYGTTSESVVSVTVVTGTGEILRTGLQRPDGTEAHWRHYGPDLTGLFAGDCGALGVKAEITLRLMQAPAHEAYASFAFETGAQMLDAMNTITRAGLASELCGFDPGLTRVRMKRASLAADVSALKNVVSKQKSLFAGVKEAAKIALAGRSFIEEDTYPLHVICEGRSKAAVDADMAEVRAIIARFAGGEIENTIPKVIRAMPFTPLNSILGPEGERWVPVHGVLPLSRAKDAFAALNQVFADMAPQFEKHGVYNGFLFCTLSTNACIIEPTFYWPDARQAIHEATIEPGHLAKLPALPADADAAAVVIEARKRVIAVFQAHGAGHFQIGRTYPYKDSRDPAAWRLLQTIKAEVDPDGRLNPGVLGLGA
ncbi:FAD-binding oxidoreductase [Caulobacter segnis]|uniref:D-lactate dehydrogenase (cytochrome) n=1 Tax=Caulobacter segnis TaxID=88688 RepID=A0A2W5VHF6_9CAUL|nr:FAD-binding oxidoreductase [Caulobacter segnis]PZR36116.1 MAG: FAD-binding oxidoreductase [Caulobacter segnis]